MDMTETGYDCYVELSHTRPLFFAKNFDRVRFLLI